MLPVTFPLPLKCPILTTGNVLCVEGTFRKIVEGKEGEGENKNSSRGEKTKECYCHRGHIFVQGNYAKDCS